MSMTELERVTLTCQVMERQFPIGTKPDWIDCRVANDLVHYWDVRRRELAAAELEAVDAMATVEDESDLVALAKRVAELERHFKNHWHDTLQEFREGQTGKARYP